MQDKLRLNNKKNGYLIVELIIGISIIVVGLLGILTISSRSMSLNRVISDQFTANYLAAEGIEIVKNIIDTNIINEESWNEGLALGGYFEADYTSENLIQIQQGQNRKILFDDSYFYNYQSGTQTNFTRTINIQPSQNHIKVKSIVEWTTRGGGEFSIELENHFFNWNIGID